MSDQAQAMKALNKANAVRSKRVQTRQRIAEGDLTVLEVLKDTPPELGSARVEQLLRWAPRIGPARAREIALELSGVALRNLSWAQRRSLAQRLPDRLR